MSYLLNPFLNDANIIQSIQSPIMSISVLNGTAFGSITFQSTVTCRLQSGFYADVNVSYSSSGYNSAVNGSYVLTGTLAPTAPITNPFALTASITVWVIPSNCYSWLDFVDKSKVTGGVDTLARIVTQTTGKVLTNAIQGSANLLNRPSWNGEGTYYNTQSFMKQSGATSAYTRFSNGGQFTIYIIFKQLTLATTISAAVFDSTNLASANIGIGLYVNNISSGSNSYKPNFLITRGVGGAPAVNMLGANNDIVLNAWNAVKITYDGTTVRMYTSASGGAFTQVATQTPSLSFSASAPSNLLAYGALANGTALAGNKMYLKHLFMEDSLMTSGELTSMDAWAQAMCTENLQVLPANVYSLVGQSNCSGRGVNASISSELTGTQRSKIMVPSPTPATQTPGSGSISSDSYWSGLVLGTNQTTESVATLHGAEMRFGYEMMNYTQNCWIVKYGVGGTPIANQGTYNDWNTAATATLYTQYYGLLGTAFDEITHVFRRTPVWRGIDIMQGETDAIITGAGATYRANWENVINGWIDLMVALGYTIDKLRIYFWQITDVGGAAYDPTEFAAVKAAQAAFPTTYFANHPSRTANVKGITTRTTDDLALKSDGTGQHYDHVGQDSRGRYMYEYFRIWAREGEVGF